MDPSVIRKETNIFNSLKIEVLPSLFDYLCTNVLVKANTVIMYFMYMGDLCVYIDIFIFILHCFYLRSQSELSG